MKHILEWWEGQRHWQVLNPKPTCLKFLLISAKRVFPSFSHPSFQSNSHNRPVLVCESCYTKAPQTGWLKEEKSLLFHSSGGRTSKISAAARLVPSDSWGRICSMSLSWLLEVCGMESLVFLAQEASLWSLSSCARVILPVCIFECQFPLSVRTRVILE